MRKHFLGKLTVVGALCAMLVSTGVYASWSFADGVKEESGVINAGMGEWETDLVLPGGDISDSHKLLIQDLLSDSIGLNNETTRTFLGIPTNGSYLSKEIYKRKNTWNRDTIGSMAIKQGDDLAADFKLSERDLSFLIWFVSSTEYHIFTTSVDMDALKTEVANTDASAYESGKVIISPVYRTIVTYQNSEWTETTSSVGYAKSAYYEESQVTNITRSKIASFDPETWVQGSPT
ncbi:MAG: hypothetical protein IJX88_03435 [Clostridia bacterium]|nr:hypothetical protein [Clostridia bacterium]